MNIITILILIPIGCFSVVSFAIVAERFLFLSRNKIDETRYIQHIPHELDKLKNELEATKDKLLFDNLIYELFSTPLQAGRALDEFLDSHFARVYLGFHKRVSYLGIFAKLSTLLGLLGTVSGMILAFNNIVEKGISTASIVAGGISGALVTTAVGLIVAIPATFFHDYFQSRIEVEIKRMEIVISHFLISTHEREQ